MQAKDIVCKQKMMKGGGIECRRKTEPLVHEKRGRWLGRYAEVELQNGFNILCWSADRCLGTVDDDGPFN
jgi:hypothetical protein